MKSFDQLREENEGLRRLLTLLNEASLRINASLELSSVLRGVLEGARSLTGARYAVITTVDESGQVDDFLVVGMTADDAKSLWAIPGADRYIEYLGAIPGPLRVADFGGHVRAMGLPEFRPPVEISAFLAVPIRHQGVSVGNIHVAKKRRGEHFSAEDAQVLAMFASQVALAVANARRHREELRARSDLETQIDSSPVGVAVFDMKAGAPVSFNRETRRIADRLRTPDQSPEELLQLITVRRADGSEISLQTFPLDQVLRTSETARAEEIVMQVPDGRSITVLLNSTPVRSTEGEVESVVVTLQDMTPLEEMERLRAEFLGMVSHELRTPLTSIRGSATAMLDSPSDLDPAELRQFLRIIVDQADIMRELIGDLLDVARIETGTLPVSPEPVDVATLVDRARSTYLSAGGRNTLEIDLGPDLPPVMADRRRIVQVIGNLLSNAARHSPDGSVIRVVAVRQGGRVEISVADEGRGMPSERLPNLFRKFSRGVDDDPAGGTGLGLAICKGVVEAHGGRIWADSDGPGQGARFTFTIPLVDEATAERYRPADGRRKETAVGEPILVVDDDPQALRYVRKTLADAGYDPIVTADPEHALLLLEEHRPHLVLLDLMLPGSDGIDLMQDVIRFVDVPVIFVSAYGRDHVIARALEKGAADYVVKPFSPTELIARIKATLRRRNGSYSDAPSHPYVVDDLTVNYAERFVTLAGHPVPLTATEYRLLFELSVNAGRALTHGQLLRRVWSPKKPGDVRALRTHIRRLRRKLGEDAVNAKYIFAVPRVGYRMPRGEGLAEADES